MLTWHSHLNRSQVNNWYTLCCLFLTDMSQQGRPSIPFDSTRAGSTQESSRSKMCYEYENKTDEVSWDHGTVCRITEQHGHGNRNKNIVDVYTGSRACIWVYMCMYLCTMNNTYVYPCMCAHDLLHAIKTCTEQSVSIINAALTWHSHLNTDLAHIKCNWI